MSVVGAFVDKMGAFTEKIRWEGIFVLSLQWIIKVLTTSDMKRLLFLMMMMMGMLVTQAADCPYLTFETTDGNKISVSTESLTLTISGTTLTAGNQSFTLVNLSKMYFSTTDESTTGISETMVADLDEATDIYDLKGNKVSRSQMQKGVYIVKTPKGTFKVTAK